MKNGESLSMPELRFDVFGRKIHIKKSEAGWAVFYAGPEGKKRPATDIAVPSDIQESEIEQYLNDLYHEWATEQHPDVTRLN